MYNFFNNTDTTQHHHDDDHGTAGSDINPNNDNNSNSKSTHDNDERNHNKPEKESTDMTRIIKNSITPVLAGFTLSVLFTFSMSSNANGFNANTINSENFDNVIATADFDSDASNYVKDTCSCKAYADIDRFSYVDTFNPDKQNFARIDYNNLNGLRDIDVDDTRDAIFARFDVDVLNGDLDRPDVDMVNDIGNDKLANLDENIFVRFNDDSVIRDGDGKFVARDNGYLNALDYNQIARVNADDAGDYNPDGFSTEEFDV